jgi:DNA-binding response OmpR family regulator
MDRSILIVEDETDILETLRDVLELNGYHVVGVGRADLAASIAEGVQPDAFMVDIMLAGVSGIELAQQLRERGFAETPMIGMSASKVMARFASQSGLFQEVIDKPFDLPMLLERIKRIMPEGVSQGK